MGKVLTDEPRTYVLVGDVSASDPLQEVSDDARARFFSAWDYTVELRRVRQSSKTQQSQDDPDELIQTINELTADN